MSIRPCSRLSVAWITFLNCIGARITARKTQIPDGYPVHFPSVSELVPQGQDMTVRIRAANVNAAYLISPDHDEVVELDYTRQPDGYLEATMPGLARFELLYLNQGKRDIIRERNEVFVREFPEVKSVTGQEQP